MTRIRVAMAIASTIAATGVLVGAQVQISPSARPRIPQAVRDRIEQDGRAYVIVQLNVGSTSEGNLPDTPAVFRQRRAIADAWTRVVAGRVAPSFRVRHRYQTVPMVALDVDAAGLAALEQ